MSFNKSGVREAYQNNLMMQNADYWMKRNGGDPHTNEEKMKYSNIGAFLFGPLLCKSDPQGMGKSALFGQKQSSPLLYKSDPQGMGKFTLLGWK